MIDDNLSFKHLSEVNRSRVHHWHPGFPYDDWSAADWANAMQGEAGEAGNIVKKIRRIETGVKGRESEQDMAKLIYELGHELADTIIYADLLASYFNINLAKAVVEKFNITSHLHDFPERLGP